MFGALQRGAWGARPAVAWPHSRASRYLGDARGTYASQANFDLSQAHCYDLHASTAAGKTALIRRPGAQRRR